MKTRWVVGAVLVAMLLWFLDDWYVKWRIDHRQPNGEWNSSGLTADGELAHIECRIWKTHDDELFYAIAVRHVDFEPVMPDFSYEFVWRLKEGGELIVNSARVEYSRTKRMLVLNPFGEMEEIELSDAEAKIVSDEYTTSSEHYTAIWESVVLPRLYHFTGQTDNGKRNGTWTCFDADGKKAYEGDYRNGKRDGEWTYFYPSGDIRAVIHYQGGKRHGKWTYFAKDGTQRSELTWNDNVPVERAARQVGLEYWEILYPNGNSTGSSGSLTRGVVRVSGQPDTLPFRD